MLYTTNTNLPEGFRNDMGLNLCKLWFITKNGYEIPSNLSDLDINILDSVSITKIKSYKITKNEILRIGNSWFVGDGMGNIAYSPCRETPDFVCYENGTARIDEKFEVTVN